VIKYTVGDDVIYEWLPGDNWEAIVIAIVGDRYLIGFEDSAIQSLVYEEELKLKNQSNKFFGGSYENS